MRTGMSLVDNTQPVPTDQESQLIRTAIRDCHTKAVSEWLVRQKPKIRNKFSNFLKEIVTVRGGSSGPSANVAERIAKDLLQSKYHGVVHEVLEDDDGEYSDVLHLLSLHMSRSNVLASVPTVRDQTPKLLKAIAQEDHLFAARRTARHDMPEPVCAKVETRATRNEQLEVTALTRAKSCKPMNDRSAPFATFPTSEKIESTSHAEFHQYAEPPKQRERSSVYNVLNSPTCL